MNEGIIFLYYTFNIVGFYQGWWVINFLNDLFSDSNWLILNTRLLDNVIWLLILILILHNVRIKVLSFFLLDRLSLLNTLCCFYIFFFKFFFCSLCCMCINHIAFSIFLFCLKGLCLKCFLCNKPIFIKHFLRTDQN